MELLDVSQVRAAAARLEAAVTRTPLLACPWAQGEMRVKAENLQPVGAFKLRGALNAVGVLPGAEREAGVVTHSSGNHGAALAYAARLYGVPCTVVVPEGAACAKVRAIAEAGARVVHVPATQRLSAARQAAAESGAVFVPPFDHRDVIAGQGTLGLEIAEQWPEVEVVVVPVGGGGLASGVATAVKAALPQVRVLGAEPELAGDAAESLRQGRVVTWPSEQTARTCADGLRTGLSELTFAHLRARLDGIVTVSEQEIRSAAARLIRGTRTVVEPSGAVAVAACLAGRTPPGRTAAVVSGGNIEPRLLAELAGGCTG